MEVALTIGPWVHDRMLRRGASTFIAEGVEWLATHLLECPQSGRDSPAGTNFRRRARLGESAGLAACDDSSGLLPAAGRCARRRNRRCTSRRRTPPSSFVFNPADPTPTVGGPLLFGGGYVDDTALADRADVSCFTGEPLRKDMYVVGTPVIELAHSADNPHVDVFVRVSLVAADGISTNVSETLRRLTLENPSEPAEVVLELDPIASSLSGRLAATRRRRGWVAPTIRAQPRHR